MELSTFLYYPAMLQQEGFYNTVADALRAVGTLGIKSIEYEPVYYDIMQTCEFKQACSQSNVYLLTDIVETSFASGTSENYQKEIQRIKKAVDIAENNGARFVMVVPVEIEVKCPQDKIKARDLIVKGMKEIVEYAKDTSVTVTMENFSLNEYPYSTIDEMVYILENVPGLKMTFDSGNFYCVKQDVLQAYERLKKYIVNVHVKDFKSDENGCIVRPDLPTLEGCSIGQGNIPVSEVLKKLKEDNYQGVLVIEQNSNKITLQELKASVEYIRSVIDA